MTVEELNEIEAYEAQAKNARERAGDAGMVAMKEWLEVSYWALKCANLLHERELARKAAGR